MRKEHDIILLEGINILKTRHIVVENANQI